MWLLCIQWASVDRQESLFSLPVNDKCLHCLMAGGLHNLKKVSCNEPSPSDCFAPAFSELHLMCSYVVKDSENFIFFHPKPLLTLLPVMSLPIWGVFPCLGLPFRQILVLLITSTALPVLLPHCLEEKYQMCTQSSRRWCSGDFCGSTVLFWDLCSFSLNC